MFVLPILNADRVAFLVMNSSPRLPHTNSLEEDRHCLESAMRYLALKVRPDLICFLYNLYTSNWDYSSPLLVVWHSEYDSG